MAKLPEAVYADYNRRYFRGRLPRMPVRWTRNLPRRVYATFRCSPTRVFLSGGIWLAEHLKRHPDFWRICLLHEMVHVKLRCREYGSGPEEHSPLFHREMHRLAAVGAFDRLW